jgi:hypothetical protein
VHHNCCLFLLETFDQDIEERIYSLPNVTLSNHAGPVASPIASSPTRTLVQKLGAVFQCRLNLTLLLILNPCLPLVAHQPTSHKVVVVSVQNPLSPLLVLETVEKIVTRENFRAVGTGAARHAGSAAVDVVGGRDFKVATLNVSSTQPVPSLG